LHYMANERETICIDGIVIPNAYTPIMEKVDDPQALRTIDEHIRTFNRKISFIFDPQDQEYAAFLEQCRQDTKALAKHLEAEMQKRDLPVYAGRNRKPKEKPDKEIVEILIRPPFLTSREDKTTRMNASRHKNIFVMHFDEAGTLHVVRNFMPIDTSDRKIIFGLQMIGYLKHPQVRQTLKETYGQWDEFVTPIADAIERTHGVLRGGE